MMYAPILEDSLITLTEDQMVFVTPTFVEEPDFY